MDAWWMDPLGHLRRSSPANERDVEEFMERTGQTEECIFTHGIVVSQDFAKSLLRNGRCPACKAEL